MAMEEDVPTESCDSHSHSSRRSSMESTCTRRNNNNQSGSVHKLEVFTDVLNRLRRECKVPEAFSTAFEDDLWAHFNRLPARYAIDVNVERAEDVLMHKNLLEEAKDPAKRPAFSVRLVQVSSTNDTNQSENANPTIGEEEIASRNLTRQSIHPPPAFGSSANLEALAQEYEESDPIHNLNRPMHEITFSTDDKPKLLSQLTSLLGELGLNIQEAHAFSTNDGYSLDVFVVVGWHSEETEQLKTALQKEIHKIEAQIWPASNSINNSGIPSKVENLQAGPSNNNNNHVAIPSDGTDVWEIDIKLLKFGNKVASGSYGDLYRGVYCSQDVAIKVLKPERINMDMQREFAQEVYIMRKVRHKNVVQFIGACTRPPSLCIITEFMAGGSVYDYLHKQRGLFKLPNLIRVAIDVSKGMNYLHQNNIIHRDLKTANLLMDENEVVKVADFGVARVKAQSGVMTAETGTYRWMAPEIIEHRPYDHKADVFSFGVMLWELLTGKIPYEYLTPLQAAVGVVQKGLRPTLPKSSNAKLAALIERCWQQDPTNRPDFSEILDNLQHISKEVAEESEHRKEKPGGFLSVLRRGH